MLVEIYKVFIFLKRRPGMSLEDFHTYYEERHSILCEKYMTGVTNYVRHYIQPLPDPVTGVPQEMDFDVITELQFEDREIFNTVLKYAGQGILPADVIEDEEKVFDRSKSRFTTVTDCVHVFRSDQH